MWKTGIVRSEDLLGRSADRKGGRRFAFTLLADLQQAHLSTDEVLLESIYNQLVVGGHVHKTTHRGRFRELDRRLVDEVLQRFANVELVRLHDIGASSAITSLELFRAFENRHPVAVHASDFYAHLDFVVCAGSPWTIVFDADGRALQFVGKRFVLSALQAESPRRPVNFLLQRWLRRRLLPQARTVLKAASFAQVSDTYNLEGGTVRRLLLVHPEVACALRDESMFTFGREDLFVPTETRYHVLRALNILNPSYFGPERTVAAVRAMARGLVTGGLLLVGRSIEEEDGRTRATAFVRGKRVFEPVWDFHEGAENRDLVCKVAL